MHTCIHGHCFVDRTRKVVDKLGSILRNFSDKFLPLNFKQVFIAKTAYKYVSNNFGLNS
jgi:hypothetical protein